MKATLDSFENVCCEQFAVNQQRLHQRKGSFYVEEEEHTLISVVIHTPMGVSYTVNC